MDCKIAQAFVSSLYDGEQVPQEAVRHIMECADCRGRLQDYAHITSEMRLLAAESVREANPALDLRTLPSRHHWVGVLRKSVRVPRLAAAFVLAALAIVTFGWVRTAAQNRVVPMFWCEIKIGRSKGGAAIPVGKYDVSYSQTGSEVYGWTTEVVSIKDDMVNLRMRVKRFDHYVDFDTVRKELNKIAPQQISYSPGQQITLAADGGGSVVLSGTIRYQGPAHIEPQSATALLPAADEMDVRAPVLIRDNKELLASASAGTRFHCNSGQCGFYLYVPGHGLFFFSTQPLPNGIQGTAVMSQILFREGQHSYSLFATFPITGGEQPRKIWVAHVPDYLPSRQGQSKSDDALVGLGAGDLNGMLVQAKNDSKPRKKY